MTAVLSASPRGGINLHFDLTSALPVQSSPTWTVANRELRFLHLTAHATLSLKPGTHYVKVILGHIENIDRGCYAAPFAVRSTQLAVNEIVAGSAGAMFALLTESAETPEKITSMDQVQFAGPESDALSWQSFDEKFGAFLPAFEGLDCHMMNGIHIVDSAGVEIVYVNFWTCGKGVDLSTHNHANDPSESAPAFAEVHWVIDAGTETAGMYRTEAPDHAQREHYYMSRGDEHGPFFAIDDSTDQSARRPLLRENGAVKYGWHGWQGGDDRRGEQAYDFVAAFEINPDFAIL